MELRFKEWVGSAAALRTVGLVVLALAIGFAIGEATAQSAIEKDCAVIGAFRIDGKGYQCTRRLM